MLTSLSDALAQNYRAPDGSDMLQKLLQDLEKSPQGQPGGTGNILKGFDQNTTPYKVGNVWHYGAFRIKPDVFDMIQAISQRNNFPLKVFLDIIARESSFNKDAKSDTGACGLVQFIPKTLYETAHKYGSQLPALAKHNLAGRVVKERKTVTSDTGAERLVVSYKPVSDEDAKFFETMCNDPEFNLELGMQYKLEVTAILQEYVTKFTKAEPYYPLTPAELYLGFFAGPNTASKIISDLRAGKDRSLNFYLSPSALSSKTNQSVIRGLDPATGQDRVLSASELLRKIANGMGYDSLASMPTLPDMRGHVYKEHRKTLFQKSPQTIEDLLEMHPPQ